MLTLNTQEQVSQQEDAVAQLAEYQAEYAAELDAIKLLHEQALTAHADQALRQSEDQQSSHEALLAERGEEHKRQLERFHAMHAEAMTDEQLLHAQKLSELQDGHARALADMVSPACCKGTVYYVMRVDVLHVSLIIVPQYLLSGQNTWCCHYLQKLLQEVENWCSCVSSHQSAFLRQSRPCVLKHITA